MAHYYEPLTGKLIDKVQMSTKEGTRDTNISDAKRLGLVPSVTTILSVVGKPMVESWRIEQGVKAVISEPHDGYEPQESYIKRMVKKADDYAYRAADHGTEIHNHICALLGGNRFLTQSFLNSHRIAEGVRDWLSLAGYEILEPEATVVHEGIGLAGTIDLKARLNGKNIIADFKSREFEDPHKVKEYRDHRWQVAGYDYLLDHWADERHIIYISRTHPGLIQRIVCTEPSKDDEVFWAIWRLWQVLNHWSSTELSEKDYEELGVNIDA